MDKNENKKMVMMMKKKYIPFEKMKKGNKKGNKKGTKFICIEKLYFN